MDFAACQSAWVRIGYLPEYRFSARTAVKSDLTRGVGRGTIDGMRIAIDARMMGPGNTRGIGRYIEELVRAMLELEPGNQYVLITRQAEHPFHDHPSVKTVVADVGWYGFEEQFMLPKVFRLVQADLVHVPHWNVPLAYRGPLVVTVHDLLLRHFPLSAKTSTRIWPMRLVKRLLYRVVVANAVSHAGRILVPTEFVKKDVASFYPSAEGRIDVTGEGMPQLELRTADGGPSSSPYLLYVGSAYPHKGLEDVLAVWPKLAERHPKLRLLLVGESDVFMRRLAAEAAAHQLKNIEFLGKVDDIRLSELYAGAAALVYPSHFEGFGLPPLEALAHGCPVVASDAASLPEVLGKNGATYFRAGDSDGILAAVERVLAEPEKCRQTAIQVARELAVRHDWKKAARFTLRAYHEALGQPPL